MKFQPIHFLFVVLIFLIGCSSNSTPTIPGSENQATGNDEVTADYAPIITHSANGVTSYQGAFGAWKIGIDSDTMSAEILPSRNSAKIGDIYDADLSQFLEVSPCADCLEIGSLRIDGYGNLLLEMRLKHPFKNFAARPDLDGFDVRGIFIVNDSEPTTIDYPDIQITKPGGTVEPAKISTMFVLNADGYTSHFDELATDQRYFIGGQDVPGNLNPFLRFYEDYTTPAFDPANPVGQNVMKTGVDYSSRVAVLSGDILEGATEFFFVADVSYGQSAVFANRQNPKYFLPTFHRTEPWRVEYWIQNNGLDFTDAASTAEIVFQVFDWQQGATVDPNYPDQANLGGIPESSNVKRLEFSIPTVQNDLVVADTPISGTGTPTDPLKYQITITNENLCPYQTYGLLAIRDELDGLAAPHGRSPIPVSPAGFPYETQDIQDYTYYQLIPVNMKKQPLLEGFTYFNNNELRIPSAEQFANESAGSPRLTIHPEFFMDSSHKRFQYSWDGDYDGVIFDVDATGLPSPDIIFPSGGVKSIGLKVNTNTVPPTEYIYTIPVYAEGVGFHKFTTSITSEDSTSAQLSQSAKMTSDRIYFLTTRATASYMVILLNIMDRKGNLLAFTPISGGGVGPEYEGALDVVEYGADAGVYITYCKTEGGKSLLYFTKCDLNGENFLAPHKKVTTNVGLDEFQPIILQQFGTLHVYYVLSGGGNSKIYGAHSSNYGDDWIEDGWIANNGSLDQTIPSAAGGSGIWLVWTELKDTATLGADLWIGSSGAGNIFSDLRRISQTTDKSFELFPSIAYFQYQIAIAYLSVPDGVAEIHPRVMFYNTDTDVMWDYPIDHRTEAEYFNNRIAISSASNGRYVCAYGAYKTASQELFAEVVELTLGPQTGEFSERVVYESGAMTVETGGNTIQPLVVCYNPIGGAPVVENFVAWRDFSGGYYKSVAPAPTNYFGQIDTMYFVTEEF
jgi:hypothetical protein